MSGPLKEEVLQVHLREMCRLKAGTFLGFLPENVVQENISFRDAWKLEPFFSLIVISLVQEKWFSLVLNTRCQEKEEIPGQHIWQRKQEADGSQRLRGNAGSEMVSITIEMESAGKKHHRFILKALLSDPTFSIFRLRKSQQ